MTTIPTVPLLIMLISSSLYCCFSLLDKLLGGKRVGTGFIMLTWYYITTVKKILDTLVFTYK